jgi:hypothetical protein
VARKKIPYNVPPRPSGYFVYTLAWPSGDIFYVGKGKGGRAESHLSEAYKYECYCPKCRVIHRIWEKRQQVQIGYVFETDDPKVALVRETELIKALGYTGTLTNKDHMPYIPAEKPIRQSVEDRIQGLTELSQQRGLSKKARAELQQEIADLKLSIGKGWQRSFELISPDWYL